MARRPRALVLAALPLLVALSGCTALDDFADAVQGRHDPVVLTVLDEEVAFQPTDPPSPPPALGKVTTLPLRVPSGATDLRLVALIRFNTPVPLPAGIPNGRVDVTIAPPQGEGTTWEFTETGSDMLAEPQPAPGDWQVTLETFGDGSVQLTATVTVPAS